MTISPLLIIAAGGTGGHMFPAQALAEAMLDRGWRVKLSTDARGARYTSGFPEAVEVEVLSSATFARGGILAKVMVAPRVIAGVLSARSKMRRDPPSVVVGFGGYPSIPAVGAAWLMGLPRALHEQNGVLGRVNQVFARRVDAIACGTWPTELPAGVEGTPTGNPVRSAILDKAASPYTSPTPDARLNVLILGGSQGARILSDMVPPALAKLPEDMRKRLNVSHQAREEDLARVTAFYSEASISAEVQTFYTDVPDRLSAAHLLIARAGASTVADVSVIGRPSILIPLASAIRDEQTANARGLVEAGAAILIPEARLDAGMLAGHVADVLGQPETAQKMAQAAVSVARPDATERLVEIVLKLSDRAS